MARINHTAPLTTEGAKFLALKRAAERDLNEIVGKAILQILYQESEEVWVGMHALYKELCESIEVSFYGEFEGVLQYLQEKGKIEKSWMPSRGGIVALKEKLSAFYDPLPPPSTRKIIAEVFPSL